MTLSQVAQNFSYLLIHQIISLRGRDTAAKKIGAPKTGVIMRFNKKSGWLAAKAGQLLLSVLSFSALATAAAAQTFSVTSVPNDNTVIMSDGTGNTITITGTAAPADCVIADAVGRVTVNSGPGFGCDQTVEFQFQTSGFFIGQIGFTDLDDFDGTSGPRDAFAVGVPGTWNGLNGMEVHSFAAPPAFADQAGRLTAAGAVGTFLTGPNGVNNPTNGQATFNLATPTDSFTLYYDDTEGPRGVRAFFDFSSPIAITISAPTTVDDVSNDNTAGANVTIPVLANDSAGDFAIDSATVVLTGTGAPAGSTLTPDGKTLTVPGEGVWTVAANGEITFAPEAGFTSDPTVAPYIVSDTNGGPSAPANITIDYDYPPVATDDPVTSGTIGPVTLNPLANDNDPDGTLDPATVVLTGASAPAGSTLAPDGKTLTVPGEGVWTVAANGEITFTPEAGFTNDPTAAPYTVADNDGITSNAANITISYGDAPIATDDPVTSAAIAPVTVNPLANDTDADGTLDPATVVLTGTGAPAGSTLAPDGKTLTVPGEGVWTVAANGEITFTPEAGFAGDPTDAPYIVDDNDGNTSNAAIVSIDYGDAPVATDDSATSATIAPVTVNPLANDTDADGTLDPATVVLTGTGAPAGSTLAPDGKTLTVPGEGVWTVAANGEITFTPEAGFAADPTDAPYTVNDNDGNTSNAATVSIDFGDAPVATDDSATSATIAPVTVNPLTNDTDADGTLDPATVVLTGTGAPAGSTLAPDGKTLTVPGEGVWTVAANGEITFTPEAGFTGDPTAAPYTVADNDGNTSNPATVSIDYGDAPVATDDPITSGTIGPVTLNPLGNDTDADGTLDPATVVLTGTGAPAGSTLAPDGKTLTVPGEGVWTVAANGEITFTPEAGVTADPTAAPYTVTDNDGNISNPATVSIDFGDVPVANDDPVTSGTVGPVTLNPLANDTDADGTLNPATVVLTGTGAPAGSTLAPDGKTLTVPGEGVWTVAANGEITFTPEAGFTGDPTAAPYTVADNDGNVSNPATVSIDFGELPVANDDPVTSASIAPVTVNPLTNDTDADGTLDPATVILTGTGAPAGSTLAPDGKTLTVPGEGVWTVAANGEITFTPEAGFTGDPTAAPYTVADNDGNTSNPASVSIDFGDAPVAVDDTLASAAIVPVTLNPLGNDMDADGTLDPATVVLTGTGAPAGSTLAPDGKTLTVPGEGVWTVAANGEITFTPEAGFTGDPTAAPYTVSDNDGNVSNPATVTVAYGDQPLAGNDTVTSATIAPVSLDPLANDSDADGTLDPTTVVLTGAGAPAGSTLAPDGKTLTIPGEGVWTVNPTTGEITFTPEAGFAGDPTPAAYTVNDDAGNTSNSATIAIDFGDAPVANDDPITSGTIGPVTLNPLGNDTDADGTLDPATVVLTGTGAPAGSTLAPDGKTLTVPGEGVWIVNPTTGEITFTPEAGVTTDPTPAPYVVSDNDGNTSGPASVSINFGDVPVANTDTVTSPTIGPVTLDPLANDNDADGTLDPTTVVLTGTGAPAGSTLSPDGKTLTVPGEGVWSVDPATGQITFTPEAGFTADPTPAPYTVADNDGNTSAPASVSIDFGDVPVANDDPVISATIEPVTLDPLANDTDPDGTIDPSTVVLTGSGAPAGSTLSPDGKTLTVPGEGVWTVNPTTGAITFTPEAGATADPTPAPYTVADNDGNTSGPASVSIDFGDVPVANADVVTSDVPGPVTFNPLANDSDSDGTIDPTTVVLTGTGAPVGSTLAPDGKTLTIPGEGVWTVNPTTGEITFTPEAGFTGDPTQATYTVADNDGNVSGEASIALSYGEPPVATNDTVTANEPGPVTVNPLANDGGDDPLDPTSVTLTGTGAPAGSVLSADGKTLTVPGEGEWTVDSATGLVTFTPAAGFSGSPTPAAYTVADVAGRVSNEAVLGVTVLAPLELIANPDGPLALDGSNGGTSDVSVLSNDTLGGNPITEPSLVTLTPVSLPTTPSGGITLNPDGTVTVAPNTTPGTYTLIYEICEVGNPTNCATAEVELVIVDTGTGLINEIEEDLESILSEDLANTLTQQSNQISGYSASALDRLQGRSADQCLAAANVAAENIFFDVDRAIIKPESNQTLDEIAAILISCAGTPFEIAGHTDSDASDAYNLDLSQRRVTAVLRALTERGVDTTGYIARGYGESQPVASNTTAEGRAQNRRVEFRPLDGLDVYQGPCEESFSLVRALDASANDQGQTLNGQFVRDQHDCITDRREVFEGTLSYLDTETGQTQSAINLSYRREQYSGSDSVFGYFVGLYGTRSDVTRLANGEINGVGLNAGVYGANRLDSDLFVDYYLGAAAGRHSFDLAFDRSIGTIDATGDYTYLAGFAGAALSGQVELGETTLTPRIGFDYVYTPGADVDVVAELGGLSQAGNLELDAISGGRVFAEIRTDHSIQNGTANLWINPRVACYQSIGALDGACGFGGSIGIESTEQDNGLTYAFELDGEWGEGYTQGSLTGSISRQLDIGTISGDAGVTRDGNATLSGQYEIQF